MAPLIRAERLTKVYGAETVAPVTALDDVSLQIEERSFTGIVGPSGSGKSTLLNLLGCLDKPSSGQYWFDGREVDRLPDDELSRLRASAMGFVFQSFNLLPRLSVVENVALPLTYQGVARGERTSRAEEMADRLGLGDRRHHRPSELSGGQAQRVGIARALVTSPRVVFADEPTGNLDSKTAEEILSVLAGLHSDGLTVVMVTHDEQIVQASDRILHIIDGKLARDTAATEERNNAME
ncbi:MAG: ABC transporter ATP-binding protein [Candidatus Brocadiaceae bacterium]|jgi:ABC-type lipoprotein export system ATPase subunit